MEFKEKLKKLRLEKGISQQTLADAIMISRSAIAKWENGLGLPNEQSLELIAAYFGVNKNQLIDDIGTESTIVEKNQKISDLKKTAIVALSVACALLIAVVILLVAYIIGVKGQKTNYGNSGNNIPPLKREYVLDFLDNDDVEFSLQPDGTYKVFDVLLNDRTYFRIYEKTTGNAVRVGDMTNPHREWLTFDSGDLIYLALPNSGTYDVTLTEEIIGGDLFAVHAVVS